MGFKAISTMLCGLPNLFGGMFFLRTEVRSPLVFGCCEIDFGGVWMGFKALSTMLCGNAKFIWLQVSGCELKLAVHWDWVLRIDFVNDAFYFKQSV